MGKYRCLREDEERILEQNGIDTEHVTVEHRTEDCIRLLNFLTRDQIEIRRGDRAWL